MSKKKGGRWVGGGKGMGWWRWVGERDGLVELEVIWWRKMDGLVDDNLPILPSPMVGLACTIAGL